MSNRFWRALTRNRAETAEDLVDTRLRRRIYPIPFERVWQAALGLAGHRRGWRVLQADDLEGLIRAEAQTLLRFVDDVTIRIGLDANAQTRVDMASASRKGKADFGKNARRIGKFLRALDRELGRRPRKAPAAARSPARQA